MKWYGSINNRIDERRPSEKPQVGMGITEYFYSDRTAYEITKVFDDKHFMMRRYDAKHQGSYGEDNWELVSNPNNKEEEVVFRYGAWYRVRTYTKESVDRCIKEDGFIALDQKTLDKVNEKGVAYKYDKANIVIGHADYYYDWSF